MRGKRRWPWAVLVIFLTAVLVSVWYVEIFSDRKLGEIRTAAYTDGFLYGISMDSEGSYIFRTDTAKGVSRYITVPMNQAGKNVTVEGMAFGKNGGVYVSRRITDGQTSSVEICLCDFNRLSIKKQWDVSEITEDLYWNFISEESGVILLTYGAGNMRQSNIYRLDEDLMTWEYVQTFTAPENVYYAVITENCAWYIDAWGNISRQTSEGAVEEIFRNDGTQIGKANSYTTVDEQNNLHFVNLDEDENYVLKEDQGTVTLSVCETCPPFREMESAVGTIIGTMESRDGETWGQSWKDGEDRLFFYGDQIRIFDELNVSVLDLPGITALLAAVVFLVLGTAFLALCGLYRLNGKTFPISLQMILLALPLFAVVYLFSSKAVSQNLVDNFMEMKKSSMGQNAIQFSKELDREEFERLASQPAEEGDPYLTYLMSLHVVPFESYYDMESKTESEAGSRYLQYCYSYRDGNIYSLSEGSSQTVPVEYLYSGAAVQAMREAVDRKIMVSLSYNDDSGNWIAMYLPYLDANGEVCGILEVREDITESLQAIAAQTRRLNGNIMRWSGLLLAGIVALVFFSLLPLGSLKRHVEAITNGDLGGQVTIAGHSEVGAISRVFNQMSKSIAGHMDELSAFCAQYAKFVPEQFLKYLKKKDIRFVKLGDYSEEAFLVADTGSVEFEKLSADMAGTDLFEFINRSLGLLIPAVEENGGMVERFQSEGALALFRGNREDVLRAAVTFFERLETEKPSVSGRAVEFSEGICYGTVRLGIIGSESRMEAAVVSEYRQLASFLKKMAGDYGARILITERAAGQVKEFETSYHFRTLGYVKIRLQDRLEKVYDVYDGDSPQRKLMKERTKEQFEEGIALFLKEDYREARQLFVRVLETDRKDLAARRYFYLCEQYLSENGGTERAPYIESY